MSEMENGANLEVIKKYYNGCTAGDLDLLHETLHPEVVHYFLMPNFGSKPVAGREHLARYWRKITRKINARWVVDHAINQGEATVIEWSMYWEPELGAPRVVTRGAEWFEFRDGLIYEIRSYYQQKEATTELDEFDYGGRGYSIYGRELSRIHTDAVSFQAPPTMKDST